MPISLVKEEEAHIIRVLPILLKKDEQFRTSIYTILSETFVKKDDFSELKDIVKNLAIRVDGLAITVGELAIAQKKSEERLTRVEKAVEELTIRVSDLALAQKRTEQRIEELAIAQKKTEVGLMALSKDVQALTRSHQDLKKQVGGLSHTVGFRLEDDAFRALPNLLKRDFGFIIEDRLKRQFILDNEGAYIEINILGIATKNGKKVTIVGEGKSQLSKNNVNEFIKKRLKRLENVYEEIFPILVTYMISEPDVEEYAKEKGIALYYSYDF